MSIGGNKNRIKRNLLFGALLIAAAIVIPNIAILILSDIYGTNGGGQLGDLGVAVIGSAIIMFLSLPLLIFGLVYIIRGLISKEPTKSTPVESTNQTMSGDFFENKHDKCPYCNSGNMTRMLMKAARSNEERKSLGFINQFECQCFECNAKWESIEK